jgi:hypothetical protein
MVEHDNVDQLAGAIKELLVDERLRKDLVRAGLNTAAAFCWPKKAKELTKYFAKL